MRGWVRCWIGRELFLVRKRVDLIDWKKRWVVERLASIRYVLLNE
jgi:hypothetical protein